MKIVLGFIAAGAILLLATVFSSFYVIQPTEVGIVKRAGSIIGEATPGLHFKIPFIDDVVTVSTQTYSREYQDEAYSSDLQSAKYKMSVTFYIPPDKAVEVYKNYLTEENMASRVLDRQIPQQFKSIFAQYSAFDANKNQQKLYSEIETKIRDSIRGPLIVSSVQIEDFSFSDKFDEAVENRMLAEMAVQQTKQNAEKEKFTAEITVTKAQAEADSKLAQAKAEAESIRIKGEAEASAIKARAAALSDNPNLVNLTAVERWNGQLPATMLPGSTLPFVGVK